MIKYKLITEGDFLTFQEVDINNDEVGRRAFKKPLIKEVVTNDDIQSVVFVTLVSIDNNTAAYSFKEVEEPGTGHAFGDAATFRDYLITELSA